MAEDRRCNVRGSRKVRVRWNHLFEVRDVWSEEIERIGVLRKECVPSGFVRSGPKGARQSSRPGEEEEEGAFLAR